MLSLELLEQRVRRYVDGLAFFCCAVLCCADAMWRACEAVAMAHHYQTSDYGEYHLCYRKQFFFSLIYTSHRTQPRVLCLYRSDVLVGLAWNAMGRKEGPCHAKSHGIQWESSMWAVTSVTNVKHFFFF